MKTIIFIFLFVTSFSYSQNKKLTIKEIDSICLLENAYAHKDGLINITNQDNKLIGEGGSGISIYLFHIDKENFNKLSKKEKREYNLEANSIFIKAKYHTAIHYINSYSENIFGDFYYKNEKLYYIKIKLVRTEKNKEELSENFIYTIEELNDAKAEKNIFLFDLKAWIRDKNKEILDFYNRK